MNSNLGWYQVLVSMAKKAGGPIQFMMMLIGVGVTGGVGIIVAKRKIDTVIDKKKQAAEAGIIYTVKTEGQSNEGLLFKIGDKFRILENANDIGLIDKIGDENSPYCVSIKFLRTISDL